MNECFDHSKQDHESLVKAKLLPNIALRNPRISIIQSASASASASAPDIVQFVNNRCIFIHHESNPTNLSIPGQFALSKRMDSFSNNKSAPINQVVSQSRHTLRSSTVERWKIEDLCPLRPTEFIQHRTGHSHCSF
jgi:hypothetical protein